MKNAQEHGAITITPRPNSFLINGPAVISFSGGRTSAYMLWRILQAHGGALPEDLVVAFANTGREMPATLDFVARCGTEWNVGITWLEYRHEGNGPQVDVVSHNSASRDGTPFRQLLKAKGYMLPDPMRRYCTEQLKVLTVKRYLMQNLGWSRWTNIVGLRADEPDRVALRHADNTSGKYRWHSVMPLDTAGTTETEVLGFWEEQPFKLHLRKWEGNCNFCFQKRLHQVARMFEDHPELGDDWIQDEETSAAKGYNGRYRADRPSYAQIKKLTQDQGRLPLDPEPAFSDCSVECGV